MGSSKIFKTLDQQIEILRKKGLIINDVEEAKERLFKENYFFINGYRYIFMEHSKESVFIKGTTFEELYAMFLFDRHMRNIMFKYILIIENNIKSILSYTLSKKYGYHEKEYLNIKNYTQDPMKTRQVKDIINKMKRQIRVNGKQHSATSHYISNYGYIPMWILVKVLSFGIVSELFNILKSEDQMKIANIYGVDVTTLSIYLALLANFRNVCAHEEILFIHRTQRVIPDCDYHKALNIPMTDEEYILGKDDLFALIIIMKTMLRKDEFHDLIGEIGYEMDLLKGRVKAIPFEDILMKIGFPTNWREIDEII